jgi:hypothetical protein
MNFISDWIDFTVFMSEIDIFFIIWFPTVWSWWFKYLVDSITMMKIFTVILDCKR